MNLILPFPCHQNLQHVAAAVISHKCIYVSFPQSTIGQPSIVPWDLESRLNVPSALLIAYHYYTRCDYELPGTCHFLLIKFFQIKLAFLRVIHKKTLSLKGTLAFRIGLGVTKYHPRKSRNV